jgi:hypothetical protein
MQDGHAVGEHGRKSFAGVEPSLFHFGDVGDDVGLGAPGLAHEVGETVEQLVVRDRLQRPILFHGWNIRPAFSNSWDGASAKQRA